MQDTNSTVYSFADTEAWDRAVMNAYNLRSHHIKTGSGLIKLFSVPKTRGAVMSSAPYATDGGVLCGSNPSGSDVLQSIGDLYDSVMPQYILFKTRKDQFSGLSDRIHVDKSYFTFTLDLTGGSDAVWKNALCSSVRNHIRKAQTCNTESQWGMAELLDDFYSVVCRCWRDLGTPVHSRAFFREIIESFGDQARLIVICLDKKPVSAGLLIIHQGTVFHPFSCTIQQYKSLSINSLMYWKIIEYACGQGIGTFDMGRSQLNQGTYTYKASWGAVPVQLYYSYYVQRKQDIPDLNGILVKAAVACWKLLPVPLTNRLGPALIKNVL